MNNYSADKKLSSNFADKVGTMLLQTLGIWFQNRRDSVTTIEKLLHEQHHPQGISQIPMLERGPHGFDLLFFRPEPGWDPLQ